MSRIISFAHTTDALLAREKRVTRRDWKDDYARQFKTGQLVDAWDRSPRTGTGKKVAVIRLTRDPYRQISDALHPLDARDEGFVFMRENGQGTVVDAILRDWRENVRFLWVVNFELVEVVK